VLETIKSAAAVTGRMLAMSAGDDMFVQFLDVVADGLSDPSIDSDAQAARLHVSRSQLDRVVRALGGEPPARLRRRILLERAAYQLVTSRSSVLDIAVEAGYASHEAFTRAFRRAFGATPSAWRVQPRGLQLDAPNMVHFHPPGGLRLPAHVKETSMDLLISMTEHHVWLIGQLIERARRLAREQLDAPIEISVDGIDREPTLRSVLSRLVGQLDMWNHAVANQPYDFDVERGESLSSMRDRLALAGPTFLGHVRETGATGRLDDTFVDATTGRPEFFTYGGMIAHVLAYGAYRRTLVVGALASAGITDFEDDPLAWEPLRPVGPTRP
jgi:AraC-like DNA-binding protein